MASTNRPAPPKVGGTSFDAFYYHNCCGRPYARDEHWLTFFGGIAERIVADLQPKRVLDAGCAYGFLVEALRARGVEAFGVDLSPYAIEQVHPSIKPYCRVGSIAEPLAERYDLIVSIEVVEHMPAAEAERAIAAFCAATDRVLFSSSPSDYREPTHVNVHPLEHWAEQFARLGVYRDVDFDASFITPWAALFARSTEQMHRLVRSYERRFAELQAAESGARGHAVEIQQRLAAVEAERDRLAPAAAERDGLERTVARLESELAAMTSARDAATETIANMERSVFWRLRGAYMALRRVFQPNAR